MSQRSIEGLRILITGTRQGIGRALALRQADKARGAKSLAAARSQPLLQELAEDKATQSLAIR